MIIIGIDIGGTHFRIGAVEDGHMLKFEKVPTASVFCTSNAIEDLARKIRSFGEGIDYKAVSVGIPAALDRARKTVLQAPNLKFMERIPVVDGLSALLGVPVIAERDVTMGLCYDAAKYDLPQEGMICGIYFGTGVGNAILLDGKPWKGHNGVAGELGHIPVHGSTIPCGCGNIGCMECSAGGKYLAVLQKEKYPDTPIGKLFAVHAAEAPLVEFVDLMAQAVAAEVNILDPDALVIGGGVMNMEGFPKDLLKERIEARLRKPYPAESLEILFAEDEPDKSVVGAVRFALNQLKGEKEC
ncbi:MAG: allose kinase [Clostridiales bacterium]|nr:allose kinase [Clostridiales bacterium]